LKINSIREFFALEEDQQSEILANLNTKEHLYTYLENRKGKDVTPQWVPCNKCSGKGEIFLDARDNNYLHASQIHLCPRKLWFDLKGKGNDFPADVGAKLQLIFDHGSYLHEMLQNYGLRKAWPGEYLPEVKLLPTLEECTQKSVYPYPLAIKYQIKSSVDAVIRNYKVQTSFGEVFIDVVHEYKSIGNNGYEALVGPKPVHKKQASIYQAVLDIPVVDYIYYNKDKDDIRCYPSKFDGYVWAEVEDKIQEILLTVDFEDAEEAIPNEKAACTYNKSECTGSMYSSPCNYYNKLCFPEFEKVIKKIGRPKKAK
jgi:hypothetical protein